MTNLNGDTFYEMRYLGRAFIGIRKASGQFIDEWLQEKEQEEVKLSKERRPSGRRESTYLMITTPSGAVEPVRMRPRVRHGSADDILALDDTSKKKSLRLHHHHKQEPDDLISPCESEDGAMMDDIISKLPGLYDQERSYAHSAIKRRVTLINVTDTNRIMLMQTRSDRLSFISLDKKTVILEKLFAEISYCAQGCRHRDHFAFVCRDGRTQKLVMYMFQCSAEAAVDQVLTLLRAALAAQPERESATLSIALPTLNGDAFARTCDMCPVVQLQKLKNKLQSLPDPEAKYNFLHDCISRLPHRTYKSMMSKLKTEQCQSFAEKNEVLTTKLTIECQLRQLDHRCGSGGGTGTQQAEQFQLLTSGDSPLPRSPSILKALKERAKKVTERFSKKTAVTRLVSDGGSKTMRPIHRELSMENLDEESKSSDEGFFHGHRRRSVTWGSGSILDLADGTIVTVPRRAVDLPSPARSPARLRAADRVHRPTGLSAVDSKGRESPATDVSVAGSALIETATLASDEKEQNERIGACTTAAEEACDHTPDDHPGKEGEHAKLSRATLCARKLKREKIRELWRRACEQAILLGRLERENRSLEECSLRRQQLDYQEVTSCSKESVETWADLMRRDNVVNNNINKIDRTLLRRAVLEGVPHTGRGDIWPFLIEQYRLEHRTSAEEAELRLPLASMYKAVLEEFTPERHAILIDLGRTFPSHPYFQSQLGTGQISLFNILKAYSLLDREVGYCQGLCFIAGIILLHLKEDEAFHMLKHIMLALDMRQQYKPEMDAMQLKAYQLSRLIQRYHPDLYQHFDKHCVDPSLYATPWFMTLFASDFPVGFAVRIFDFLLLEGPDFIFSISLALLAEQKLALLAAHSLEDIVSCFKTVMPAMRVEQMDTVFRSAVAMDLSTELALYREDYAEGKSCQAESAGADDSSSNSSGSGGNTSSSSSSSSSNSSSSSSTTTSGSRSSLGGCDAAAARRRTSAATPVTLLLPPDAADECAAVDAFTAAARAASPSCSPSSGAPSPDATQQPQLVALQRQVRALRQREADQAAVVETLQRSHLELAECVRRAELECDAYRRAVARLARSAPADAWSLVEQELAAAGVPAAVAASMRACGAVAAAAAERGAAAAAAAAAARGE